MSRSQPYTVACAGGLVTSSNAIDLLKTPGVATDLSNFEVSMTKVVSENRFYSQKRNFSSICHTEPKYNCKKITTA